MPQPPAPTRPPRRLELLAPAGDRACLEAAVGAGADAVYLGLRTLNARRRARNFSPDEFRAAVQWAHQRRVRVYLTLNIDLSQRDLDQAARTLALAQDAGADAVLLRDPAVLALRDCFPRLEFHFSTQTCPANSADVAAAMALGAQRVVLARELTRAEIAAASAAAAGAVQTEVFVQGALCFCVSGRCLLSSWLGGRSGNRGTCTSPCRLPWTVAGRPAGTPLSMHDLALYDRLAELQAAGVRALKIEGRLKTPDWVARAVGAFRRALDGADPAALAPDIRALGGSTGRRMTAGYLDGRRDDLTGLSGREAATRALAAPPTAVASRPDAAEAERPSYTHVADDLEPGCYALSLHLADAAIACCCTFAGRATHWTLPRAAARRAGQAVTVAALFERLGRQPLAGCRLQRHETNAPDFPLLPPHVNAIAEQIALAIRRTGRAADDPVRIDLPDPVARLLAPAAPHPANIRRLGDAPDRVRLEAERLGQLDALRGVQAVIVEGASAEALASLRRAVRTAELIAALPAVFFEADLPALAALARACAREGIALEVNSWGGWQMAREAGAVFEAGPGLGVLNALAARQLGRLGARCVTLAPEADRRQLEDLSACCGVPASLGVFGRPALMTTRVELPAAQLGQVFQDRRGVRMVPRLEQGLAVFRPLDPFDWRDLRHDGIRAAHLVVDLVASPDPAAEWRSPPPHPGASRFNYDRALA